MSENCNAVTAIYDLIEISAKHPFCSYPGIIRKKNRAADASAIIMIDFTIERDNPVSDAAIEALRLAVGRDEEAGKSDQVLGLTHGCT